MIRFLTYETNNSSTSTTNADLRVMFVNEKWSIIKPQQNQLILTD